MGGRNSRRSVPGRAFFLLYPGRWTSAAVSSPIERASFGMGPVVRSGLANASLAYINLSGVSDLDPMICNV